MDFSELVAIVREPNTPSGAHESIRQICTAVPMAKVQRILDVGSNTGFATLEFASLLDAEVVGIDINEESKCFAEARAKATGLENANFVLGNILELPFEDGSFDMVYCNNVTSFIADRERAIFEYRRVLRPGGFISMVPLYYITEPPKAMVDEVSFAINAPVVARGIDQWLEALELANLLPYYRSDFAFDHLEASRISEYAAQVVSVARLNHLSSDELEQAKDRLTYFFDLFERNLRYCGFSVLIYRLSPVNDFDVLHTWYER